MFGIGFDQGVHAFMTEKDSLYKHTDEFNDYQHGYNVFCGACLSKMVCQDNKKEDVRVLSGAYSRALCQSSSVKKEEKSFGYSEISLRVEKL